MILRHAVIVTLMRRLKAFPLLLLAASIFFAGCAKDDQVTSALNDLDSFTAELVKKVESASDPRAGVTDAQMYLDSRKSEISSRLRFLKGIRGTQVSEETKRRMLESINGNALKVIGLRMKYSEAVMKEPIFRERLEKLISDYQDIYKA